MPPGEFLAYHFAVAAEDRAWLNYLQREALAYGSGRVPHEAERLPVIQQQVEEIRRRQAAGLVTADLDPALLRLLAFALVSYPRLLPQITRMASGRAVDDPSFVADWEEFLRAIGARLGPGAHASGAPNDGAMSAAAEGHLEPGRDGDGHRATPSATAESTACPRQTRACAASQRANVR